MARMVEFHHGALCDPYEKQANEQGFTLGKEAERLQNDGFYLAYAYMHDLLTDSMYGKALQRLQKKLIKALKPLPKKEGETNASTDG